MIMALLTTWIVTWACAAACMISSTCRVERARRDTSLTTTTSPATQLPSKVPISRSRQSTLLLTVSSTTSGTPSFRAAQYSSTPSFWVFTSCMSVDTRK
jgi:hypothetical protein